MKVHNLYTYMSNIKNENIFKFPYPLGTKIYEVLIIDTQMLPNFYKINK